MTGKRRETPDAAPGTQKSAGGKKREREIENKQTMKGNEMK